jgi:sugar phosphate isomerase/epimerase
VHVSTEKKQIALPFSNAEMQTASVVMDINKDGTNDFIVTCRNATPAIVAYIKKEKGWRRLVIEQSMHTIEAGGAHYDIDGDGDEDVVFGGDWQSNEVWWWENPFPVFKPGAGWKKHTIKAAGEKQHHDQVFGDFKHTGKPQLAFWNQGAKTIFIADIPMSPRSIANWDYTPIFTGADDGGAPYPEGMTVADIDSDGWPDLLAGNTWLKYDEPTQKFKPIRFANYGGRIAVGRLKAGKMQQIVIAPGDGTGPLMWYECNGNPEDTASWKAHNLSGRDLIHAHTLELADINGDGLLDIFTAEMAKWSEKNEDPDNAGAEAIIFYGNGAGNFKKQTVLKGFDFHEGRITDADGDGDADIISKPYNWKVPRLDVWLQNGTGKKLQSPGIFLKGRTGIEIYSLREYMKKDIPGTFQKIKKMGIAEVEIPEFYGLSVLDFKKELDKAGLLYPSILFPFEKLKDSLETIIAQCKILGVKYAGCAWIPHNGSFTRELAFSAAEVFNHTGERMKKEGIHFVYHPHGYEFIPSPEGTLMDVLADAMKPGIADFELDILWSHYGGEDPVAFMNKHKGRILLMHLKDLRIGEPICNYDVLPAQENDVAAGKGQLNMAAILKKAVQEGVKHFFIEDESSRVIEQIPETIKYIEGIK